MYNECTNTCEYVKLKLYAFPHLSGKSIVSIIKDSSQSMSTASWKLRKHDGFCLFLWRILMAFLTRNLFVSNAKCLTNVSTYLSLCLHSLLKTMSNEIEHRISSPKSRQKATFFFFCHQLTESLFNGIKPAAKIVLLKNTIFSKKWFGQVRPKLSTHWNCLWIIGNYSEVLRFYLQPICTP